MAKESGRKETMTHQYSKEQLLRSQRYIHRRDLLGALLKEDMTYTLKEVDDILNNYMKGKVK